MSGKHIWTIVVPQWHTGGKKVSTFVNCFKTLKYNKNIWEILAGVLMCAPTHCYGICYIPYYTNKSRHLKVEKMAWNKHDSGSVLLYWQKRPDPLWGVFSPTEDNLPDGQAQEDKIVHSSSYHQVLLHDGTWWYDFNKLPFVEINRTKVYKHFLGIDHKIILRYLASASSIVGCHVTWGDGHRQLQIQNVWSLFIFSIKYPSVISYTRCLHNLALLPINWNSSFPSFSVQPKATASVTCLRCNLDPVGQKYLQHVIPLVMILGICQKWRAEGCNPEEVRQIAKVC